MLNWHAFVLSSLWEGLPCAIVEARLLKLPVLSYNTGGIRDVIQHGKNGYLYHQKDWQKLEPLVGGDKKFFTVVRVKFEFLSDEQQTEFRRLLNRELCK